MRIAPGPKRPHPSLRTLAPPVASFAGRDLFRKRELQFSKIASEPGAYLITCRCGLYPRRARNRRAALSRTRSIQPQAPGDLGLHGAGLVLADQYRAADLSSCVESDCDHVVGAAPAAAFDINVGDVVTADGHDLDRTFQ